VPKINALVILLKTKISVACNLGRNKSKCVKDEMEEVV